MKQHESEFNYDRCRKMKFFISKLFFNKDEKSLISFSVFSNSLASFTTSKRAREYLSEVSVEKDLFVLIFY